MGLDVYAYTVFGKMIQKSDLIKTSTVRGCQHDVDTTKKFCSECGKPVWVEKETMALINAMDDKGLTYFYNDYQNQDEVILGFKLGKSESSRSSRSTSPYSEVKMPTPEMTSIMEIFCKANDIQFSSKDFKTYTFNYMSY